MQIEMFSRQNVIYPIGNEKVGFNSDTPKLKRQDFKIRQKKISALLITFGLGMIYYFICFGFREYLYCPYESQFACWGYFFNKIGFKNMLYKIIAFSALVASILSIPMFKLVSRYWIALIVLQLGFLYYISDHEHGYTNFTHIFIRFTFIFSILFLFILNILYMVLKRVFNCQFMLAIIINIIILAGCQLSIDYFISHIIKPSNYWTEGVNGKELKSHDQNGNPYCTPPIPRIEWNNLYSRFLSYSSWIYDCTYDRELLKDVEMEYLRNYFPGYQDQRFIAFPNVQKVNSKIYHKLPEPFWRQETQQFILGASTFHHRESQIPDDTEYILDVATFQYKLRMKRNEEIIQDRLAKFKFESDRYSDKKLPKNMILIYVDSLSRVAMAKKLPKTFKWYSEYMKRQKMNKDESVLYQAMRFTGIATFTYHNMLAFDYGIYSYPENLSKTSLFSFTEGLTDYRNVKILNPITGRYETRQVPKGGYIYQSIVNQMKQAGYITGLSSTDCAITPITMEGVEIKEFLRPPIYDHVGISPVCDPNYFEPNDRGFWGVGTYSVFRRCLYGRELLEYAIDYGKKFLSTYKDDPKYYTIELMEAHETTQEVIRYQDDKLYDFLNWLEENNYVINLFEFQLEDSILMFMSDHGNHMLNEGLGDNFQNSDNGFPIFIMLLKRWHLNDEDMIKLQQNEQTMTTHFEIHYFLKYIINFNTIHSRINSIVGDIPVNRTSYDLPWQRPTQSPPKCVMRKH